MNMHLLLIQLGLIKTAGAALRAARKGLISATDYASHMKIPVADVEAHLAQQKNFAERLRKQNQAGYEVLKRPAVDFNDPEVSKAYFAAQNAPKPVWDGTGKFPGTKGEFILENRPKFTSNFDNPLFSKVQTLPENRKYYRSLGGAWNEKAKTLNYEREFSLAEGQPYKRTWTTNNNAQAADPRILTRADLNAMPPISQTHSWGGGDRELLYSIKPHHTEFNANFAHVPATGATTIPDIRAINRSPLRYTNYPLWKATYDRAMATIAHEFGHVKTLKNAERYQSLANTLERVLAPTRPTVTSRDGARGGWNSFMGNHKNKWDVTAANEMVGHFKATQGNSPAAKAAIRLPLEKMQQVAPEVLAQWQQALGHLPPNLKDRFLAVRAHAYTNYKTR